MSAGKWRFPENKHGTRYGINDAGIKTFSSDALLSLVRETIQNSLGAWKDNHEPLRVEFSQFILDRHDFPDLAGLVSILEMCSDLWKDKDAQQFLSKALQVCSRPIDVLRISDFNTTGLSGAESGDLGTSWSRLIKERGSSNQNQTALGSFGIGKSAPFACSDLRTVFYSSMDDEKRLGSTIGVSRLVTYVDRMKVQHSSEGYYSDSEENRAILKLHSFEDGYIRTEPGTDIYIMGLAKMGMSSDFNLVNGIIYSVLTNFLVSLWKGNLEVVINKKFILNRQTLPDYIQKLSVLTGPEYDDREIFATLSYYYLLTNANNDTLIIPLDSSEYGRTYGFRDGECTLYLRAGDGLNRKVLITRKGGMEIFEMDRLVGNINFVGALLVEGDNMNKAFREMEDPAHRSWKPSAISDQNAAARANEMLKGLRNYIKSKILENFLEEFEGEIDAYGVQEFLPDSIALEPVKQAKKEMTEGLTPRIANIKSTPQVPKKTKNDGKDGNKSSLRQLDENGDVVKQMDAFIHTGKKKSHHGPTPYPGENPTEQLTSQNPEESGEEDADGFHHSDAARFRIFCIDKDTGRYRLRFSIPKTAGRCKLEFFTSGEQTSDDGDKVEIHDVAVASGELQVRELKNNVIVFSNVVQNDTVMLDVSLKTRQYSMMEVVYYEG